MVTKQNKNRRVKQNSVEGSRLESNTKRKKTNLILNILIIIVSLLIVASLYFVILATDNSDTPTETKTASSTTEKEDAAKSEKAKKAEKQDESASKDTTTTEKSDDPNVNQVITKDWKPVGTKQSGEHVNSYDATSRDWKEKIQAFSEATGIDANNMTLWFVGRGADPATESIGTVSDKSTPDKAYRVYIAWRDGEGWQPMKVEELKQNDKR
ncbi:MULTISPECIES: YrrS family protein [unclassified Listeria]|uniref:YrrS family protein n=1 Tax=unclassified Listeria TaxID=2642072 RepID=UPI000B589417|nr:MULTISPECIES: YrrS family protein [unclassified Listeria]